MTPREQRIDAAVNTMAAVLEDQGLSLDDAASAVFSLTLKFVIVVRAMDGINMQALEKAAMQILMECDPPSMRVKH